MNQPLTELPQDARGAGNNFVRSDGAERDVGDAMNLVEIVSLMWRSKWLVIFISAACVGLASLYVFTTSTWYEADVLLKPTDTRSTEGLSNQLGGALASIAGIDLSSNLAAEPLAVLQSREFTRDFITDQNLMPELYAQKWDSTQHRWKSTDPTKQPDLRDGVTYFDKKIRKVVENRKTSMVTLSVQWKDAATASRWANGLVDRVNDVMRRRALAAAEYNVDYLKGELASTNVVTMQQSIGKVLESELQKLLLAKGNKEFAFRIIDHAEIPKHPVWPMRIPILIGSLIFGIALSTAIVLARKTLEKKRSTLGVA